MSKSIDLSYTGGFPWFDDYFDYMQQAWQEVVGQLLGVGVNGTAPMVLSSMVSSTAGSTVSVSAGWFVYGGQAIRFPAQTYALPVGGSNDVYVVVTPTAVPTAVAFNDGSTPAVIKDVTGVLTVLPNTTAVDATHFLLNSLAPFQTPDAIEARSYLLGQSDNFKKRKSVICAHLLTGANANLTLDLTGAVPGVEITYYAPPFNGGVGVTLITTATLLSPTPNFTANNASLLKVKYLGKVGGIDYITAALTNWVP